MESHSRLTRVTDELGISPVIGVILVVAITVALSVTIGVFVLDLGAALSENEDAQVEVATRISYHEDGTATVQVVTGDADTLNVLVDGAEAGTISNPAPGDSINVPASTDSQISVVAVTDGDATVVSSTSRRGATTVGDTATAPTTGLVAHWEFEGNVNDSAGSHHGTAYGDPTYVSGKVGQAIALDGVDDRVYTDWDPTTDNRTLAVWYRTSDGGSDQTLIWTPDTEGELYLPSTGELSGRAADSNGWKNVTTNSTTNTGNWHHAVLVIEADNQMTVYINGTTVGSTSIGTPAEKTFKVALGYDEYARQHLSDAQYLNGTLDDVRFYNRTLNKTEVEDLYHATK